MTAAHPLIYEVAEQAHSRVCRKDRTITSAIEPLLTWCRGEQLVGESVGGRISAFRLDK
jgi:hypothetical protein